MKVIKGRWLEMWNDCPFDWNLSALYSWCILYVPEMKYTWVHVLDVSFELTGIQTNLEVGDSNTDESHVER